MKSKLLLLLAAPLLLTGCKAGGSSEAPAPSSSESSGSGSESSSSEPVLSPLETAQAAYGASVSAAAGGAAATWAATSNPSLFVLKVGGYQGLTFGGPDTSAYPDNAEESVLSPVISTLASFLPSGFAIDGEAHFYDGIITEDMTDEEKEEHDFWGDEDGSTALEAYYVNSDLVVFDFVAYCYQGYLIGDVYSFQGSAA